MRGHASKGARPSQLAFARRRGRAGHLEHLSFEFKVRDVFGPCFERDSRSGWDTEARRHLDLYDRRGWGPQLRRASRDDLRRVAHDCAILQRANPGQSR